jgi:hypothetical protein
MQEVPDFRNPRTPRTWIPCALSTLALFGLSTSLRTMAPAARLALQRGPFPVFQQERLTLLEFGCWLWIPLLIATAGGLWMFRRSTRTGVLTWFLWTTLSFGSVYVLLLFWLGWLTLLEPNVYHPGR